MEEEKKIGRREFLRGTAMLGIAGTGLLSSCGKSGGQTPLRQPGEYYIPELPDKAVAGRKLKVGMVGCGGRGTGALGNLLDAADDIEVVALGDIFQNNLDDCRRKIKASYGREVPDENCFLGFDAYKKVIDSGIDMVILTTPPLFRPEQFAYATEKGVHSFLEKPVAVDPKGYRQIVATSRLAEVKGLSVVTGTQRRHQRDYVAAYEKIQQGIIGQITGGTVYWLQGNPWYCTRTPEMTDMEYMIRDWFNWKWLSGDHIVEQHVHNIDVFMWMTGLKPFKATGFGARHRRRSGDQFDMFYVDFEFEKGVRLHSQCRQIDGCSNRVGEVIQGTKGYWRSNGCEFFDLEGNSIWKYDKEAAEKQYAQHDPYVLEHVDWVNHIRKGTTHVEAEDAALSCLAGMMGRESAYDGRRVLWDEYEASQQSFMPETLEICNVDMSQYRVPEPGVYDKKSK